jgi:MFS transporter, DHA1 family, tetracycline resistance protein
VPVVLPTHERQIKRGVVAKRQRTPVPKGYWTIWTTVALDLVGFGIIVPILGRYAERYGASGLTVGFLFASFSLAQLMGAPLLGRLSDRIGRKPVIVISLIGTAIGSFVTGAAGVLWLLFAGRIIDGASGGSLSVAQAAVADIAPEEQRPGLIGMLGAAFGIGFVLGPAIGGLAALGGPHVPFYVAGVLASINAIAAMIRLPETRQPGDRTRHVAIKAPTSPVLRHLAIIGFITVIAFTAFEATFSLFGDRRFGLTEASSAAVFLGVGLVLVAIQGGAYGRLVKRFGTQRLFAVGLCLLIAGLAVTAVAKVWPVLIVALLLLAVGQGVASPSITSIVTDHAPPERRGEALGYQQSANGIGRVLGPPAAGAMFDRVGIWSPYAAGSVLCGVAMFLVVTWGLDRRMSVVASGDCENVPSND